MLDAALPLPIAQADPGAAAAAHHGIIADAIDRVLRSGSYVLGDEGDAFERAFSRWLGVGHTVACASGTDALVLALLACGAGPGTAVAVPAHTAVATVAAIMRAGAVPLLLDIDPEHYTLDPEGLAAALDRPPPGVPPVRAVIPVHLYGQPADMAAILELCRACGVSVVEDCSQAHGAAVTVAGVRRKVGTMGDAAAFSFYPTKNLAALGDGGAVTTASDAVAARVRRLRQYGWDADRVSQEPGLNSRLDELQAAILRARLPLLDAGNRRRNAIAAHYDDALAATGLQPPRRRAGCSHVFHQYVIGSPRRDTLRGRLATGGIATGLHYARPVHGHPAYATLPRGPKGCGNAEAACAAVLSLPIHPELTDDQVARVCTALRAA